MRAFADHRDAGRVDGVANGLGDLVRHPLLDLQPPREHVDQARDLAEAHHAAVGDVGDVALAEERQQVVLAQTVVVDVAHDHHLVVIHGEQRAVEDFVDVGRVAARQERHRLGDADGRLDQPFAVGVFAQVDQELPDQGFHGGLLYRARASRLRE